MSDLLNRPGREKSRPVIAVIGSGGKTTALKRLAREGSDRGLSVFYTTTTHIYPLNPPKSRELLANPDWASLKQSLKKPGIVCAGKSAGAGKLTSLDEKLLQAACRTADLTVCEADGSRHLPLKLHRKGEPVLPPETSLCLIVAGLSALGRPMCDCVHRYELHPGWKENPRQIAGASELVFCIEDAIRAAGRALPVLQEKSPESSPASQTFPVKILLNQADLLCSRKGSGGPDVSPLLREARKAARLLSDQGLDCRMGSLNSHSFPLWEWIFDEIS